MFDWLRKPRRPDWVISIPDGHAATASIAYKGRDIPVRRLVLDLSVGCFAMLHLELYPRSLETVLRLLDEEPVTVVVSPLEV